MAVLNLVTLDWLFTAALFVVTVILVKIHASVRRKKEIMGDMPCYPGYLPLLGHAHLATQFTYTGFIDEIRRTRKDNKGTLHIWVGPKLCAYVANPDDVENVFNRKDAINKGFLFSFFHSHSLGIVTSTTPRWNHMRRLANIPMAHKQMIDSFEEIYQYNSKVLLERLATVESGDYLDINRYLSRCCQDITYGAHFGVNLDIQHSEEFNAQDTVPKVLNLVFERMMKVWLYPDFIYDMTQRGKDMKRCVKHHQNVARKILSERRRILKERKENMNENEFEKKFPKVMDVYLNEQSGLTDDDIVDNIMDLMLVGFEAMSQTQGWVVLLLAMFPQYQDLVQAELDEQLGPVEEEFTLAQLQKCQYLDMVTREALRLFGLPVVIRKLESDVSIEHYTLPAEAEIIIGMCMVHRDARYWDHPDQFYPDHFLPEKVAARPKNAFVPFGLGPRKCPAYSYGMATIKFVVATLLRKYRFTTKQDYDNLPLELLFMYKPADGFLVRFEPRHVIA